MITEQFVADPIYYWVLLVWNLLIAWVLVSYKKLTSWIPKLFVTCFIWPCAWALVVIAYNLVLGESGRWRYDNYVVDLLYQVSQAILFAGGFSASITLSSMNRCTSLRLADRSASCE